jgi:MscS family membrane protein
MKRLPPLFFTLAALLLTALPARAQETAAEQTATNNAAAAALLQNPGPGAPAADFLEHLVDSVLVLFDVKDSGNTTTHYVISALFLVGAFLLRRAVTGLIFHQLKKLASKTETTLDDKLFPALETPVATFVMVTGIFAALKVLKLSEDSDRYIGYGSTVAFSLVIFWGLLRAFNAVLEHAHEVAKEKDMGVAAFMPWIKKTLIAVFVIFGGLMVVQSLGYDVKTLLAGLGIGGLAFALAAQDTIANLFGSIVVAIDQPFKVGETVKVGASQGVVEDIGLRSTKIRLVDKSLVVVPNKSVASEAIVNLSRFTGRRTEQVFGLTYDSTPEQLEAMVEEIRKIITAEPEVDPASVNVYFRDLSASSLDIWSVYVTRSPDNNLHLATRQRINLAVMRAVAARGLSFAFPTQTVMTAEPVAKKQVEKP